MYAFSPASMYILRAYILTAQHQLGQQVSPGDFKPEYNAQSFAPGTASPENTYLPNPPAEVGEGGSQALNPDVERSHGKERVKTTAGSTLGGATSKEVNHGLGHPGVGQTNSEIRHEGQHHRKHQRGGLEGVGSYRQDKFERRLGDQRGLEKEGITPGQHGDKGSLGAEEIQPESA